MRFHAYIVGCANQPLANAIKHRIHGAHDSFMEQVDAMRCDVMQCLYYPATDHRMTYEVDADPIIVRIQNMRLHYDSDGRNSTVGGTPTVHVSESHNVMKRVC